MAKFAILDAVPANAQRLAAPLIQAGHDVLLATSEGRHQQVIAFRPRVLIASIYRRAAALEGLEPLRQLLRDRTLERGACIVIGHDVQDHEVRPWVPFDLFVTCQVAPDLGLPIAAGICLERGLALSPEAAETVLVEIRTGGPQE